MTRKLAWLLVVGVTGLAVSSPWAHAQTNISMGATLNAISFTGVGNADQVTMSFGALCDATHCPGFGSGQAIGDNGFYSITGSPTITLTDVFSGFNTPTNDWNVTQSAPLTFCFSSAAGCGGTVYLQGNLQLVSFDQSSGGNTGTFNPNHTPDLILTGGTLESIFGPNPVMDLVVNFGGSPQLLTTLLNNTDKVNGVNVSSGEIDPNPTPEPATIALVGSGLLTLGTALRRRVRGGKRGVPRTQRQA